MEIVTSKDGTSIAYGRSGSGPPVILVGGATADHPGTSHWPKNWQAASPSSTMTAAAGAAAPTPCPTPWPARSRTSRR
jgi:hypothetical protein